MLEELEVLGEPELKAIIPASELVHGGEVQPFVSF